MLWYKTWLETRMRFLLSLVGVTFLCAWQNAYRALRYVLPSTPNRYYYNLIHATHDTLCFLWLTGVTLLAMGGLLREKAAGTSSFTLTLPVSRSHLMGIRICVVFVEALLLAVIPMGAVVMIIGTAGKPHLLGQAWFHIALLVGGGTLFVGLPLLISSLVEGEYTAPVAAFGVLLTLALSLGQYLHTWDPVAFLSGGQFFNRDAAMLLGPIPWVHIAVTVAIAAVLTGIAVKVIQKKEF